MNAIPATPRARSAPPRWLPAVLAPLLLAGCQGDGPFEAITSQFETMTPGEAARLAISPYDADDRRRGIAALAAAPWGGDKEYLRLYRTAVDDEDPTVRAVCLKALGMHGQPQDATILMTHLTHEDVLVRWEAAKALQKIHNPVVIDALIDRTVAANEDSPDVREAAARALGQYASRRVFNALVVALDDPDFSVVHAAHESLHTLTGADLGTRSREWVAWRNKHPGDLFDGRKAYTWKPYNRPWHWYNHLTPPFVKPADKPARPPTGLEITQSEPDSETATP